MSGFKIIRFLGTAPKISPELLPDTAAQISNNAKLQSGDLIPYPEPVVVANTGRSGTIRTLHALRSPVNGDLKWLSWTSDVSIAIASSDNDGDQRFYYTGDGVPKVSNYELATGGPAPYPYASYDLGLPIPEEGTKLTTTSATFSTATTANFARDTGNIATITTTAAHGLRNGNLVTITGFTYRTGTYAQSSGSTTITVTMLAHGLATGASVTLDFTSGNSIDGTFTATVTGVNTFTVIAATSLGSSTSGSVNLDLRQFNVTSAECTVTSPTTFTYFCPGPSMSTTTYTNGKVDLGGLTQARSYVFTWFTPWDEESVACPPSTELYIREGIQVTVSNIPTAKPTGNNYVRAVRLYRTLASASGTDYYRLKTLWFPTALDTVARTSNVATVALLYPHGLGIGDRFKISGCTDASFDVTGGIVTDLIDQYTFTYSSTGSNKAETVVASGTIYYDVAQDTTVAARYWGDGGVYTFLDDFDSTALTDILTTDEYDPPPSGLQGLVAVQNSILVGFVDNEVFFSEKNLPHAWPRQFSKIIEPKVVALVPLNGACVALTESYPYLFTGSDPANISVQRIDALYPCLNPKSVVTMDYGIVYSTHDGLAVFSTSSGAAIVTKALFDNDSWNVTLDPTSVIGTYYGDSYLGSFLTGSFIFERDEQIGGFFTTDDFAFTSSSYDSLTGKLYITAGTAGDIYEWDNLNQPPQMMEWKSKVLITKDMMNLGAARVVADYADDIHLILWEAATDMWEAADYTWDSANPVTFKLYADKELVLTTDLTDSGTFRLPTGYRTDTYEVSVSGDVRIRAIHLAETPLGLKEV